MVSLSLFFLSQNLQNPTKPFLLVVESLPTGGFPAATRLRSRPRQMMVLYVLSVL
jgi:hypothetical protein